MVRRLAVLLVTMASLVALSATTYGAAPAKTASATGTWSGPWKRTSSPPTTGTMTVTLTQTGSKVTGSEKVVGSACLTTHDVTGTVKSGTVTWKVSQTGIDAKYTGTISGKTMTGKLTVTCSGVKGVGTFNLSKKA